MNIIERVKNILLTPKTEWKVIEREEATPMNLLTTYVIPLALIGAIATFIGYGLLGGISVLGVKIGGMKWGMSMAIQSFVGAMVSYFICTYIIDALAPNFGSEKNINKSAQLVAFASTASWVAAVFNILPMLSMLAILGLYSIYLFYIGLPIIKKTPDDKRIVYMIVSAVVIIVIGMVVNAILTRVGYMFLGNPYANISIDNILSR